MATTTQPQPGGNGLGPELAQDNASSVLLRPRCASRTRAGQPCRAYPAADGWPWCSVHRYLHTRTAA